MSNYRKLIAASVGLVTLLGVQFLGIDLTGQEDMIVEGIIAVLTAFGVWAVPNAPKS